MASPEDIIPFRCACGWEIRYPRRAAAPRANVKLPDWVVDIEEDICFQCAPKSDVYGKAVERWVDADGRCRAVLRRAEYNAYPEDPEMVALFAA